MFAAATLVTWFAGVRLAHGAEAIARHTGFGHAFLGVVLLGLMVSLPELTFAVIAAARGHATMAVNSLLGGLGFTMVALAITDFLIGHRPLSVDIGQPVVLLQGVMAVVLLALAAGGISGGDVALPGLGTGIWSTALIVLYGLTLWLVKRQEPRRPWVANSPQPHAATEQSEPPGPKEDDPPLRRIVLITGLAALAVIAAGTVLTFCAEALAQQTGLGESFVGFMLGGLVTTLPELSTAVTSAKLRAYEMTISDAFGSSLCSLGLIFLADLAFDGGPILNESDDFAMVGIQLAIVLHGIYLAGLLIREKRTFLRMGLDSFAVLATALGGFTLLFFLR